MEVRLLFLICTTLPLYVTSQQTEKLTQNPCVLKQTCSECIRTPTCSWCAEPMRSNSTEDVRRCFQRNYNEDNCKAEFAYEPDIEYTIIEAKNLSKATKIAGSSSSSSGGHHEAVQIAPQKVNLKLRINEAHRMTVDYKQAEDYPVDLYYLMDLSKSMEDDKDKLSSLGTLLVQRMESITKDFRLGFGSFVDKVVMPYVSVVPKKLIEPCELCVAPYGYRNHMSLTDDTKAFSRHGHPDTTNIYNY